MYRNVCISFFKYIQYIIAIQIHSDKLRPWPPGSCRPVPNVVKNCWRIVVSNGQIVQNGSEWALVDWCEWAASGEEWFILKSMQWPFNVSIYVFLLHAWWISYHYWGSVIMLMQSKRWMIGLGGSAEAIWLEKYVFWWFLVKLSMIFAIYLYIYIYLYIHPMLCLYIYIPCDMYPRFYIDAL